MIVIVVESWWFKIVLNALLALHYLWSLRIRWLVLMIEPVCEELVMPGPILTSVSCFAIIPFALRFFILLFIDFGAFRVPCRRLLPLEIMMSHWQVALGFPSFFRLRSI